MTIPVIVIYAPTATGKTALILTLIGMILAFGAGVLCGMTWTKASIPNNVVQIQVGDNEAKPVVETAEEGK